jgi:thimet oligopeptidase
VPDHPNVRRLLLLFPVLGVLFLVPSAQASKTAPLIDYSTITAEDIQQEMQAAMDRSDAIIDAMLAVPDGKRTFANTLLPLNSIEDLLGKAFGKYAFLGYVATDEALREMARTEEEKMNKYGVDLGFREDVYNAVLAYSKTKEAKGLQGERARYLEFALRDYRRNGFGLDADVRKQVQDLRNELVELGTVFDKTLADWEDGIVVPENRAGGLPENYLSGLEKRDGGYWVSLDYPDLVPFMELADDAELRKELIAKNWNEGYPDNLEVLERGIAVRDEIATLLGYPSWAAYRIEPRMARTPEAAQEFLDDLARTVHAKFEADIAAMKDHYAKNDPDGVNYWDWRYYHSKAKRDEFNVDQAKISEYFPLQQVLDDGLFAITQEVFGLRYEEVENPGTWHEDVQLFEIYDAASGEFIANFYTDLFPREGKYGHAAAFPLRGGGMFDGKRQAPISAIVANFTKPAEGRPSLLTHDEVETLFHEFGHILHQTLTTAELQRFAGSSTEQDFVEAPSQNLEHWMWEPEVLGRFARHYQTGDPLPTEMLDGLVAAKQLNSGITTLRQVMYASLDMAYHGPGAHKNTTKLLNEMHPICGFPNMEATHFQCGFGHLFGYDAAYYGYLWSKVYGDDMYTAFEQGGILNPEVGMRYRKEIYEKGGTLDGMDLARNFLGREPNNEAFLRDLGLEVDGTTVGSN